jgi:hypothetical protein
LDYNARREHADDLRSQLVHIEEQRRDASTAKQRRQIERREKALRRRLAYAQELADYDWDAAEADFAEFVSGVAQVPGAYERWRAQGVPIRVLLRAGVKPLRSRIAPRARHP